MLCGVFVFFADSLIGLLLGLSVHIPTFSPFLWNFATIDGNVKWLSLIVGVFLGIVFITIGLIYRRKQK